MDDMNAFTFRKVQESLTMAKKAKINAARDAERMLTLRKQQEEEEEALIEVTKKKATQVPG